MRSRTVLALASLVFSVLVMTMFARASDVVRVPCPRYKKVLIKREIVCGEKCQLKCIVEEIVHQSTCCEHCQAPAPVTQAP